MDKKTYSDLLDRLYDGTSTEAENRALRALTDRQHEAYFNLCSDRRWDKSSPAIGPERLGRMRRDILRRLDAARERPHSRKRLLPMLCRAAAMIALVAGASVAGYRYAVTARPEQRFEVATGYGQKNTLTLPDGTVIRLNSGSRIVYGSAYNGRSRTVELEGEACFSVASNPSLPFVVRAGGMSVTALGTQFNVKAYADEPEVVTTLIEGKIRAEAGGRSGIVLPAQQARYDRASGAMSVGAVDDMELPTAWLHDRIVFSGERLDRIARTLERMYNIEVLFRDDACRRHAYRGVVHNNSLHNVLDLISTTSPVEYRITGSRVEFRSRQP